MGEPGVKRILCSLLGHPRFVMRYLNEGPGLYIDTYRYKGRALSWPTCVRCGYQLYTPFERGE